MKIAAVSLKGNNATRRQAKALAVALQAMLGKDVEISYLQIEPPPGAITLPSNTIVTWPKISDVNLSEIRTVDGKPLGGPYDLVIGCRPEVAAVVLAMTEKGGHSVQIQDPNDKSGTFTFNRTRFDVIVKQSQEAVEGPNVIASRLPLHDLTPEDLAAWRKEGLKKFPKYNTEPATIVLIGGSDEHVSLSAQDFANFGTDIAKLAERGSGDIFVLSSRRTTDEQKAAFKQAVENYPNVFFDQEGLTYNNALGIGSAFISDAGSGSMGAEVEFTGMPWTFYSYRGKLNKHPQMGVWPEVKAAEFPLFGPPQPVGAANEAPEIAARIIDILHLQGKSRLASITPA